MRQRKRIGSAVAATAVLAGSVIAGGTAATAETLAPALAVQESAPTTIELPTGDRVTVFPNGTNGIEPGPGREDASFITPPSPSGDLVVVPIDRVAAIEAGEEDPRRYNVSALLRAGEADAAAASASELDDRPYAGLIPDTSPVQTFAEEDLQKLNVSLRDRDGEAPGGSNIVWVARDGSDFGRLPVDENGTGGIALPPGDYVLAVSFWDLATDTARGERTFGIVTVTVGDEPTALAIDAADAAPVGVEVEQEDAVFLDAVLSVNAGGALNVAAAGFLGPEYDAFLLPEPDLPDLSFLYQPTLASPEGSDDPYAYNLAFHDATGFPDDPSFAPADDDLAIVETSYRDLGTPYSADVADTCDYGDYTDRQLGLGFCRLIATAVPSERTMYYTADPEINWTNALKAGESNDADRVVNGFLVTYDQIFEAGESERTMPNGGLSSGVAEMYQVADEGANAFGGGPAPVGGGNNEDLIVIGARGDAVLTRDGETIAAVTDIDFYRQSLFAELPEGDAGRYTLTADTTQSSTASVFGTDAHVAWTFDIAPIPDGEVFEHLPLPVVQLTSEGIEGGYAERGECQEITLDLRSYEYGPVVHAEEMSFEVSYDDGATWKEVELDRDGDTATAELDHPRKARWVSVRMTALDDQGTEVEHTTIRAYGLR